MVIQENVERSRSPRFIPHAILGVMTLLALVAVAFGIKGFNHGPDKSGDNVPKLSVGPKSFVGNGPFGVGVTTLHLPASQGGNAVELWYPVKPDEAHGTPAVYDVKSEVPQAVADIFPKTVHVTYTEGGFRGVPVADGRFPVVVFSHGFAGFKTQSAHLTSHLASWGFVVAAPDHPNRDLRAQLGMIFGQTPSTKPYLDVHDLQHTISMLGQLNAGDHSIFKGHLDMNRVGAMGHSAGGAATEALSAVDPRVKAWIGLAGATVGAFGQTTSGPGSMLPKVPSMIMAATDDGVVHYKAMLRSYGRLKTPKRFVALGNSGHLVFSDICRLGDGKGGLVGVGRSAGLPIPANLAKLGSDGCNGLADSPKTYLPVQVVWPAIDQAVVAQFRFALGFDDSQAGLENLAKAFSVVSLNLSRN